MEKFIARYLQKVKKEIHKGKMKIKKIVISIKTFQFYFIFIREHEEHDFMYHSNIIMLEKFAVYLLCVILDLSAGKQKQKTKHGKTF